ncbi:permease prefix domain 1-containing protein [Nonomuraea rhizosphaerae]|uniref:permease prefix domain 1-containing protein n=1 Tax=Nonomuraea rhizosphaerae TaxID=2665663 RepID=UPI001C601257|nr:permease prefix domain 1-containing protein [Nonomuraea rhizosphaerae]
MLIDDYVSELDRALAGPSGAKRDLVVEARDSLADAADALESDGLARAEAERLAVREFGPITDIAPGYQRELTAMAGRRLGLLLLITVPVAALAWSMIWRFYPTDSVSWANRPDWYSPVSRALDLLQLAVGLYGGLCVFALGRGTRWIRRPQLVTRWLGIVVWLALPVTWGLSLLLTTGADLPLNPSVFLPGMLANLMSAAFWGLQLYGATRCIRVTRTA